MTIRRLRCRLDSLFIQRFGGGPVAAVPEIISLPVQCLRYQGVILKLTRESERLIKQFRTFVETPSLRQVISVAAEGLAHPETVLLNFAKILERLFLGVLRTAVAALILEDRSHAVGLHRDSVFIAGGSVQTECAHVLRQSLLILPGLCTNFGKVMYGGCNIAGDVDLLAELQGLLEIDAGIVVISFEEIGIAYIVQAETL